MARRGRPPFKPTKEQRDIVESTSGYGIPHDQIARLIGITKPTLEKHFRNELDVGAAKANAKVVESLYEQAVGGNVTAAIWWTKARLKWSEKVVNEHVGKDGSDLHAADLSGLSVDNLRYLRGIAKILANGVGEAGPDRDGTGAQEPGRLH